ncbi:hypothetical protein BJ508DRAFT_410917 [Ascobolus immersus RN42]|uniref:Galactose oxidase n=1 Tax=Ascobolus immersus RN42 TaxID=1160509 RepID=A0A3N4IYH4_ASCIM|nr:hypothetical protein BJ508DRAFT_410917 [Ascobolus immersus RN42]
MATSKVDKSEWKRCWHQQQMPAVVDDKIYLIGGLYLENRPMNGSVEVEYHTSPDILVFDFTKDTIASDNGVPYKTIPIPTDKIPVLQNGAFWSISNDKLLLSNGMLQRDLLVSSTDHSSRLNLTREAPLGRKWEYTISTNTWKTIPKNKEAGYSAVKASTTFAKKAKKGFVVNGGRLKANEWRHPVKDWQWALDPEMKIERAGLESMLVFDGQSDEWSLAKLPGWGQNYAGAAVTVEGAGKEGVVVVVGGSRDWDEKDRISLEHVQVYDIASGNWYNQSTTVPSRIGSNSFGFNSEFPDPRTRHCAVTASSPDGSSHNIYIFGGRKANGSLKEDEEVLNDVWVLSLPSFTWTKLDSALGFIPKIDTPCALVGEKYMFALATAPEGVYTSLCSDKMDYQLLDLTTGSWIREFKAGQKYKVPEAIYSIIGGDENGKATLIKPENGFVSKAMGEVFGVQEPGLGKGGSNPGENSKPGSSSDGGGIGAGAIAGIIVGAVALVSIVVVVLWLLRRRKRKRESDVLPHEAENTARVSELYGKEGPVEADGTSTARSGLLSGYGTSSTGHTYPPTELPVGERVIAELGTDGPSHGHWRDVKEPVKDKS